MARCIYFKSIIFDTSNRRMARLRCKKWSCSYCASVNRKQWRKALYDFIASNPEISWSFHTFTLPAKYRKLPLTEALNFIKKSWQKLLQALRRLYGHFEFIRVVEFHKDGTPHLHLLAGFNIPAADLSKSKKVEKQYIKKLKHDYFTEDKNKVRRKHKAILIRLGYGYMTNSQNAYGIPEKTVSYITKYMTKVEENNLSIAKREKTRLIQTSRKIKLGKKKAPEGNWQIRKHLDYYDYHIHKEILDLNKDKITTAADLDDSWQYPPEDEYID